MKQFEGNKAGMPFGKKGFFKEARDMGMVMREARGDQRVEVGADRKGRGFLTRRLENAGLGINKLGAKTVGNVASLGEKVAKGSAGLGMKAMKAIV